MSWDQDTVWMSPAQALSSPSDVDVWRASGALPWVSATRSRPSTFEVRLRVLEARGDWPTLVMLIEDTLEEAMEDGGDPEEIASLWVRLASVYAEVFLDDLSAHDACCQALDADPDHLPALWRLEEVSARLGDFEALHAFINERFEHNVDDGPAVAILARLSARAAA